jgi:hypothetical protein
VNSIKDGNDRDRKRLSPLDKESTHEASKYDRLETYKNYERQRDAFYDESLSVPESGFEGG